MEIGNRKLLPDDVYENLLEKILTREWKLNHQIPSESQLAQSYQVSRVSVRSALQRLQALNLIITKPGKGSFVATNQIGLNSISDAMSLGKMDLSKNEYRYVVELRNAIEFKSIELMAIHGQPADFDNLHTKLELMKANVGTIEDYVAADYAFHLAIIKGSHNPLFVFVMEGCKDYFIKYFTEMAKASHGQFEKPIENHTKIYEAMQRRDAEEAKSVIIGTFEYNLSRFKDLFKE